MGAEGVLWGQVSSPTLHRYHGDASGNGTEWIPAQVAATSYFDARPPWGLMGRVSMRPDGSVASRCPINQTSLQVANNWGDNCYSDTDTTGGENKMVYVPAYCLAVDYVAAHNIVYWIGQVGDTFTPQAAEGTFTGTPYTFTNTGTGYSNTAGVTTGDVHPAFVVDGVAKPYILTSAYEGYNNNGVLRSMVGVLPTSVAAPLSIANARIYANANYSGQRTWGLQTLQTLSASLFLLLVEYGSLYISSVFGIGNVSGGGAVNAGGTASYGNKSYAGGVQLNNSYRGIEAVTSNLGKFIEGMNLQANQNPWVAPQSIATPYVCNSFTTPYADTGHTLPTPAYITSMYPDWMLIPSATSAGGSVSTYWCGGSAVQQTVNRVAFQGTVYGSSVSGAFGYSAQYSTVSAGNFGYRIQYLPP